MSSLKPTSKDSTGKRAKRNVSKMFSCKTCQANPFRLLQERGGGGGGGGGKALALDTFYTKTKSHRKDKFVCFFIVLEVSGETMLSKFSS